MAIVGMRRGWTPGQRRLDAVLVSILLAVYPAWSWRQGQDVNYDGLNYHLYASLTFLAGAHQGDLLPGGTQTFLNPLASLPAAALYYGSQLLGPLLPTLLLSLVQGLALVVVYGIGLRLFQGDRPLAFLAALLGGTAPLALSEAGNTMADLTLALLSVSSLALALPAAAPDDRGRRWRLALAAGLAGAAVGMKLTFVVTLPLLLVVALLAPVRPRDLGPWLDQLLGDGATGLLAFVLSLALFASPQLIQASRYTGNPVFPLFNQYFRSPLHEDVQPTEQRFLPDSTAAFVLAPLFDFTDSFYPPFNPALELQTRRSELSVRDLRTFLWALASLALLLVPSAWRRQLDRPALALVLGLTASYVTWLGTMAIGRYAIPLQLLQGLVLGMACQVLAAYCPSGWGRWSRPSGLLAALLALVLATQLTPSWGRTRFAAHWTTLRSASEPAVVPLREGRLQFPERQPLVLLDRPIGWIKAHSLATHNPLLHWDPGIAPRSVVHSKLGAVQARIEGQLLASGFDSVLVLTLATDPAVVAERLRAFLVEAPRLTAAGFRAGACSTVHAGSGAPDFSLCRVSRPSPP